MASASSNDGEEDCSVEQQSAVLRTNGIPPLLSIVAFISQVWKYFILILQGCKVDNVILKW